MSNKIFCLKLELLFAVICLIWLADHLLMKGLSLNFRLADFTAHKSAGSSKIEKTKKIFAPAQSKVALAATRAFYFFYFIFLFLFFIFYYYFIYLFIFLFLVCTYVKFKHVSWPRPRRPSFVYIGSGIHTF